MPVPWRYRLLQPINTIVKWISAQFIFLFLKLLRLVPFETATRFFEGFARWLGPKLKRNRIAMDNLAIAFPDKPLEERKKIASDSWAQMARTMLEYGYLDKVFDLTKENTESDRIEIRNADQYLKLRDDGLPAILFTGHLANFELLPLVADRFGLKLLSMFRQPNNKFAAKRVAQARNVVSDNLVPSGDGASFQLMSALERGDHVGLLVDQKFRRGIMVPFFGKDAPANPLLAKLARRYKCPVHGARTVRLPNGRFRLEITEELDLPKDENGDVDIRGTTELVNRIIEDWVREYPEQWLWIHRRWG
jgi:KDO2-lipid IV(A) lauroyltransferase